MDFYFRTPVILQAPSVLGATNNADSSLIPEECTNGNYRELIGPNHEHRYFNYSSTTLMKVNENTRDYSVGYDNWFRFRLAGKATRMLERNELEQDVSGVVGVCISFDSSTLSYGSILVSRVLFMPRSPG